MAFVLSILHNVESAGKGFSRAVLHTFEAETPVRVGSSADCECVIDSPEVAAVHCRLEPVAGGKVRVVPETGAALFLNDAAVDTPTDLASGDEIRIGHWSVRFRRLRPPVPRSRSCRYLALVAKGLVAAILFGECLVVIWLPLRARDVGAWHVAIAAHRTGAMLDALRGRVKPVDDDDAFAAGVRSAVAQRLLDRSRHVREYGARMTRDQRRALDAELRVYEDILNRLEAGSVLQPVPSVEVDRAVDAVLENAARPGK